MSNRHRKRKVTGRGLTCHTRGFAPEIDKMNTIIQELDEMVSDIFFSGTGQKFDRKMGLRVATDILYQMEKSSTEGLEAYMREKKVFMKYLGLFRADNLLPRRLDQYVEVLDSNGDHLPLLREYAVTVKLLCPQIRNYKYRMGQEQASWGNYRIRPVVMTLYAIQKGKECGVEVNTDDIVLGPLRFFPPYQQDPVDEAFLKHHIDNYFIRKASEYIDYKKEFHDQYAEVLDERGKDYKVDFDGKDFQRKCRNAANNAWCLLIFLRNIGLIEAENRRPTHWSSSDQEYERTFKVQYQVVELTEEGETLLTTALQLIPVWYADIVALSPLIQVRDGVTTAIEELGSDGSTSASALANTIRGGVGGLERFWLSNEDAIERARGMLESLGLDVVYGEDVDLFEAKQRPLFDREYDIP